MKKKCKLIERKTSKNTAQKIAKKIFFYFVLFAAIIFMFCLFINIYITSFAKQYIYSDFENLPKKYVVIVPGAKVYNTTISFAARDRAEAAMNCINEKKAQRILISGDHGTKYYDEVNAISNFMQKSYNTDMEIIFLDHAGFSTYETMYRAKNIFCVNDAIIATQKFHAARCVYIARKLGIDAVAIEAAEINRFSKGTHTTWAAREFLARVKAFFSVSLHAKPKYMGNQIPITGSAKDSWD